jgi:hypothetical protein
MKDPKIPEHVQLYSPTNLSLVQMHEGIVSIDLHYSQALQSRDPGDSDTMKSTLPPHATHLRIYLSTTPNVLGSLYATIQLNSAGGVFFYSPI